MRSKINCGINIIKGAIKYSKGFSLLGRLCRDTGRSVTVIVISSLFTEEDSGMTTVQKHKRIMNVIGKKVFDPIIKEMEKSINE